MQCCGKTWLGAASCRFGEWCVFRSAEHRPTKASAPCVRGKSSPANIITYLSTCISRLPAAKKYAKCAAWSTINSLSTVITRNKTGRRNAMMGVYLLMDELLDNETDWLGESRVIMPLASLKKTASREKSADWIFMHWLLTLSFQYDSTVGHVILSMPTWSYMNCTILSRKKLSILQITDLPWSLFYFFWYSENEKFDLCMQDVAKRPAYTDQISMCTNTNVSARRWFIARGALEPR